MPAGRPPGYAKTGGRAPGTPNRITGQVRERFEEAFTMLQYDDKANLLNWAKGNTTEFYKLASKLIPVDMSVQGNLTLNVISGVPKDDTFEDLA